MCQFKNNVSSYDNIKLFETVAIIVLLRPGSIPKRIRMIIMKKTNYIDHNDEYVIRIYCFYVHII